MGSKLPVPLFILGSGRSGTTLAASLINRFPRVHIAKETGFLSRAIDLLEALERSRDPGKLLSLTNSWLEVEGWKNRASKTGFDTFRHESGLECTAAAFMHYVWQLDSLRASASLDFIGDNTPAYVWAIPKLQEIFPEARYIHMVRDPRDVAASMIDMRFGGENAITAALDWQANVGAWQASERIVPAAHRMELRYEDLCNDTAGALKKIALFLGQDEIVAEIALAQDAQGSEEFGSAKAKPHHQFLSKAPTTTRIGVHRTKLSEREIAAIEAITQPMMAAYGYKSDKWHLSPHMQDQRSFFAMAYGREMVQRALKRLKKR